jgi:uncharacterized protein YbjT (DUF2867 family)
MNLVLGASGQVGTAIVKTWLSNHTPVIGVVRNPEKGKDLEKMGPWLQIDTESL